MQFRALLHSATLTLLVLVSTLAHAQPAIQWSKCYGSETGESFAGMVEAFGDGYVLAGTADSCKYGQGDFWIVKIDDTGQVLWTKCYGGSKAEWANAIVKVQGETANQDGYMVLGRTTSTDGDITLNNGGLDYCLIKLDINGELVWQKSYGGSGTDEATAGIQTTDGNVVIAGMSNSTDGNITGNHGNYDWWIVKVNQAGGIIWQKTLGGSGMEFAKSLAATNDGGVVITGFTTSVGGDISVSLGGHDIWVVKLNASGNVDWDKSYGSVGLDQGSYIMQTIDHGYLVGGSTVNYPSSGQYHGLIKVDSTGVVKWTAPLKVWDAVEINADEYIIAGPSMTGADGLICRSRDSGSVIWNKALGGTQSDFTRRVLPTSDGGYIVGGDSFSNDGDVSGNHGGMDYWVVKLASDPLSTHNLIYNHSPINVYPNPATDEIHFSEKVNVRMVNLMGQAIADQQQVNAMNISSSPAGVYFLIFYDKQEQVIQRAKIIKE